MSAERVLQLAVEQQLIEPKTADQLRPQLAKNPISAEGLIKFLIGKQLLTPPQGKRLLAAVEASTAKPPAAKPPAAKPPAAKPPAPAADEEEIVDLEAVAPAPAAPKPPLKSAPPKPPVADLETLDDLEPLDLSPLPPAPLAKQDDLLDLEPLEPLSPQPKPAPPKPAAPKAPPPDDLLELEPLDSPAPAAAKPAPPKPTPKPAPPPPQVDVLDLEPLEPAAPTSAAAPAPPKPAAKPPAPKPAPAKPAPAAPAPVDLFADPLGSSAPVGADLLEPLGGADPFGGGASDPFASSGGGGALESQPKPEPPKRKGPVNRWDSPLLYVGGAALGLTLIAFILLLATLTRGNAAEVFAKAEDQYKEGSYTVAMDAYDKFLKGFPDDPNAPLARIRRGMAELRQAAQSGDPRGSLQRAKEVLPRIETLPKFEAARPELTTILPEIADGLATQAKSAVDTNKRQELAKLVEDALALVNNPSYIPSALRSGQQNKIESIQEKLVAAKRSIDQDKDLAVTVTEMKAAVAADKPLDAYKLRADILAKFPGLEPHPQMVEVTKEVAAKELDLVTAVADETTAATDDPQADRIQKIPAASEGGPAPVEANQVAAVLIKGAVYGIAVKTGRPLWRRHLGTETVFHPIRVDKQPAADILVADAKQKELLRLAAPTGKVKWRLPIGDSFFGPVLAGEKIFVTTAGGEVWEIDVEGGGSTRRAKLPQTAQVAPAVGARNTVLYQPGAESTLFALGVDLGCRETTYLAHRKGTTRVPPLAALGQVFVVENGADFALIHALSANKDGVNLKRVVEPFRLRGRIITPGVAARNRVVFATDLGEFIVFEIDFTNESQPIAVVGRGVATEKSSVAPFVLTDGEQLWLASRRLDKYEIQGSLQQTARKWSMFANESFVAPLQLFGETLLHTRQRSGTDSIVIEAAKATDGGKIWTLELGSPMAGLFAPDSERVVAVSRAGRKFDWRFDERGGGELAAGALAAEPVYVGRGVLLGEDTALFQAQKPGRLLSQSLKAAAASPPQVAAVGASFGATWQQPVEFAAGILAPNKEGAVTLLHPDGKEAVLPFLPSLTPNKPLQWHRPAVVGTERKAFVIASDDGRLFRVATKEKPRPHLSPLLEGKLADRIVGPLAAAGDALVAVVRRDDSDVVLIIDAATLKTVEEIPQPGRVMWGPEACGDATAIGFSPDRVVCVDAAKKVRWSIDAATERLAPPTAVGDEWLSVAANGEVLRISAANGEVRGRVAAGEPLGPAVLVRGTRLIAAAADGTLLVLPFGSGT